VWQALRNELHPLGIEIVTVALDTGGADAVRQYIEAAQPEHPSLIDQAHICDDLLGFVNVPMSVWIDEHGIIVRPAEPAWPGSTPVLDMLPALTADVPPERLGLIDEIRRMRITPEITTIMLRDWAANGADSEYVLSPDEVIARSLPRGVNEATAAARFELGQHLFLLGDHEAAVPHWREAHRLDPSNWTYKRQAWSFEAADSTGPMERYEGNWLDDVRSIGAEQYYAPIVP
jgi:tetratricopeptide (TPR) repeat protein